MTNFLAQLLQPPPPTTPTDGKIFSSSQPSNSLPQRQMTPEDGSASSPTGGTLFNEGPVPELVPEPVERVEGIDTYATAQQAEQASLLAQNATSDPDLDNAFRAIQAGKYDQWQQKQQQQNVDFWESGLGGWLKTNPAIAYAQSVNSQLLAPRDMGEDQPPKQPGLQEKSMAALVAFSAFSEMLYNSPIPGTNVTSAQLVSKGAELSGYGQIIQSGAMVGLTQPDLGRPVFQAGGAAMKAGVEDFNLANLYNNPDYWGMTPEQAEKFAAAPRSYVGMEQPWFTPLMLPNPDAGKPMSQAELMRYQAEWVLNTERDASIIAGQAAFLLGVAESEIDYSNAPVVQQLLRDLGIPTPQQQQPRSAGVRLSAHAEGSRQVATQQPGIPHIGMAGPAISGTPDTLGMTGTYSSGITNTLTSATAPNSMNTLGIGAALQFDQRTAESLIQAGWSPAVLSRFSNPVEYAKLYNTPEFFELVSAIRTVDALERDMPLSSVQDQSIPLLNQMAFDITMGTDTVLGLLGDTIGFSGRAARMGVQMGILEDAATPTASEIALRIGRGLTGNALSGPLTKEEAATRILAAGASGKTPPAWRFGNDLADTAWAIGGNIKEKAQTGLGLGMAGFGATAMWNQALGDDPSMGPVDRATAMAAGSAFGFMGLWGMTGMAGKAIGATANFMFPHGATAGPDIAALATAEANRTFNNLNILRNREANANTSIWQRFIRESADAWAGLQFDERPKYVIDIETTLKSQDIFQIALRPLEGGEVVEWLIKPPSGADAGLEASKDTYQRAIQSGMTLEQAMSQLNERLGDSSILIGHNVAGFDLQHLLKAGLAGDHTAIDTLAMALHAGVQTPTSQLTLEALYSHLTGNTLTGAHDARTDIAATADIYNRLVPEVSRGLGDELTRVNSLNVPEIGLADLNTRTLPSSLHDILTRRETTYRVEDQIDAITAAFPGLSQAQILQKVQAGEFSSFEQYLFVYGNVDGQASLDALTQRETDFYRQRGADFDTALLVYDKRAKAAIQGRIRYAAPQYSDEQVEATYNYLLSQYQGYSPTYISQILPPLPYRGNAASPSDTRSAPFWADLLSHADYDKNAPGAPAPSRPGPRAMSPFDFLTELKSKLRTEEGVTPETFTEMMADALGVTERAQELKLSSIVQRQEYLDWLAENPGMDIRQGLTAQQWDRYANTPLPQLPSGVVERLLGERPDPAVVARQSREAYYGDDGGTLQMPLARKLTLPKTPEGQASNGILDALRGKMVADYGRNAFGSGTQAVDALGYALEAVEDFGITLPETTRWAYETAETLLYSAGDNASEMLRIPVDPKDTEMLNKLLALNEMGPETGIRVDLRGIRSKPVINEETGIAQYLLEVPISYVSEWNPSYSYANRQQDLTTAYLNIELAKHEQRAGTAERNLGLTTAAELQAVTSPGSTSQAPHAYAGFTAQQLQEASIADTQKAIDETLLNITRGRGDSRLPATYRNLQVSSGLSPETWNELAAAYSQNRITERVGDSASFDRTQAYGMVQDTASYIRNSADSAGMVVTATGQVQYGVMAGDASLSAGSASAGSATGGTGNTLFEDFESSIQATNLLRIGATDADNPFVIDQQNLLPGMRVTTAVGGEQQTGTIVSRLGNGSYRVAYERPASNTYPEAAWGAGVSFRDDYYTGESSATFYRNVKEEDIAQPYASGGDYLTLPLRQARDMAQDQAGEATQQTTLDFQAQDLLYKLFSGGEVGQPLTLRGANKIDPEVLRRADQIMEQSRSQQGYFSGQYAGTEIDYYIDWKSYSDGNLIVRPGAPELAVPERVVPELAERVEGAGDKVDPYATSTVRSANFMLRRELAASWELPPSATTMQQQDILSSLIQTTENAGYEGRTEPYSLYSPRQAQQAYVALQETAKEQGMTVILTGVGGGGLQYQLRPRTDADPLINPDDFDLIGRQTNLFLDAAQQQGQGLAGSLINRLQERIITGNIPGPDEPPQPTPIIQRPIQEPPAISEGRYWEAVGQGHQSLVDALQQPEPPPQAAAAVEKPKSVSPPWPWTTTDGLSEPPEYGPMTYAEALARQNPAWKQETALEAAQTAADESMRATLTAKIAGRQSLNPAELSQAQALGLLDDKVFIRLIEGNYQLTANGVLIADQGARRGDKVVDASAETMQFTQNWLKSAGINVYDDVNLAMGQQIDAQAEFLLEGITFYDRQGNQLTPPPSADLFKPRYALGMDAEAVQLAEQQYKAAQAAEKAWAAQVKATLKDPESSDLVIMREGQLIAPRHTTHRGYEPEPSIPATLLDEIREADSALLDENPSEGMVARSRELGNWQEEQDPTKAGYPGYGADDPEEYNWQDPFWNARQNQQPMATDAQLRSRQQTQVPILVLDKTEARRMLEAAGLELKQGPGEPSAYSHYGPNQQALDTIAAGSPQSINVHFTTQETIYAGRRTPAQGFIAGPPIDEARALNAPSTVRDLDKQASPSAASAHGADIAVNFFNAMTRTDQWVRNQAGEWVRAIKRVATPAGEFNPAKPEQTPQYAVPGQAGQPWRGVDPGAPGAINIWRTSAPGQLEPSAEMGIYRSGETILSESTQTWDPARPESFPGTQQTVTKTAPQFTPTLDLLDWYKRVQDANQLPAGEKPLAMQELRQELADANKTGEWTVRTANIYSDLTGQVRFGSYDAEAGKFTPDPKGQPYLATGADQYLPLSDRYLQSVNVLRRAEGRNSRPPAGSPFPFADNDTIRITTPYVGALPTYQDLAALTYGGGEMPSLTKQLTEQNQRRAATELWGERMDLLDETDFPINEDPALVALAAQDAEADTQRMAAEQIGLYQSLAQQGAALVGQEFMHNGYPVTIESLVPPGAYSTAVERTGIDNWHRFEVSTIESATNPKATPRDMTMDTGGATLVNVVDYDGNRYSVPLSKLDRTDADGIALDSPVPLGYDIDEYASYVNKTAAPPAPDLDDPLVPSTWQPHDGYEFPFEETVTERMNLAISSISGRAADIQTRLTQGVNELRANIAEYNEIDPGALPADASWEILPDGSLNVTPRTNPVNARGATPPASMVSEMTAPAAPAAIAAASYPYAAGDTIRIVTGRRHGSTGIVQFNSRGEPYLIMADGMSLPLADIEPYHIEVNPPAQAAAPALPLAGALPAARAAAAGTQPAGMAAGLRQAQPPAAPAAPSAQTSTGGGQFDRLTVPELAEGPPPPPPPPPSTPSGGPTPPGGSASAGSATAPAARAAAAGTTGAAATPPTAATTPTGIGAAAARAAGTATGANAQQATFGYYQPQGQRARFAVITGEGTDPNGDPIINILLRPTNEDLAQRNPPVLLRAGQQAPWESRNATPDEIVMRWNADDPPDTNATELALRTMDSPGRPQGMAAVWRNLFPFNDNLTTSAIRFREAMDPIGSLITSATDDPDNYVAIMRALAQDPSMLVSGIPGSMLKNMENQLDANGMFRLGAGIADRNFLEVQPILAAGKDTLFAMADHMEAITRNRRENHSIYTPDQWKQDYNAGMVAIGTQFYGADQQAVTTRIAREAAGIQRSVWAEAVLNLFPGTWIANAVNARMIAAAEGQGMNYSVLDSTAAAQSRHGTTYSTARLGGSVEGDIELGAGGFIGKTGNSYANARGWANWLVGYAQGDDQHRLTGYTGGILEFLSDDVKTRIHDAARAFDARFPGSRQVMRDDGTAARDRVDNPLYNTPMAQASLATSKIWTTNTEMGSVAVGEGAMYASLFTGAEQDFYRTNAADIYAPVFDAMSADASLGLASETITTMRTFAIEHATDTTRANLADELTRIATNDGAIPASPQLRGHISEILGANDTMTVRALGHAAQTAGNIMLEPTHQTNLDSWLSNVFAFSYFGTRTAANWAGRSLRNPMTLGLVANFAQAARIEDEREAGTPARYKQSLAIWEGGPEVNNIIAQASGFVRMMGNPFAQQEWDEADNPVEYLAAAASMVGLNPLPLYAMLLGEDPAEIALSLVPYARIGRDAAMAAGTPVGTSDEFNRYRAARWIGAQAAAGVVDENLALMAQQSLYDEQWDTDAERNYPKEVQELVSMGFMAVGQEAFVRSASNAVTGFGVKQAPNQNEIYAGAIDETLDSIRAIDSRAANTAADLIPGIEAWYARSSIYPEQPDDQQPMYQPLERMNMWLPQIGRAAAPAGWSLPAWDMATGKTMTDTKNQSVFASETNNTAVYFLLDPRNNEPFYVGQSNQPSNRYVQHIEDVNADDVFAHPKKLQTAELLQQGLVPEMATIGWYAGDPKVTDDDADKAEQMWIGYFFYVKGKTANITVPRYEDWQAILTEKQVSIEDLDAEFAQAQAGALAEMEQVKLAKAPNITDSPFYDTSVPAGALGNKARLWSPDQPTWDWGMANQATARPIHAVDWAADQWGLEGVGDTTRKQLWSAGFTSWEDLATPSDAERKALLGIGSEAQVDEWIAKAQYTVGATKGYFDVPPPPPPTDKQLNDGYPSTIETLYALQAPSAPSASSGTAGTGQAATLPATNAMTGTAQAVGSSSSIYTHQMTTAVKSASASAVQSSSLAAPAQGALGTSYMPAWASVLQEPDQGQPASVDPDMQARIERNRVLAASVPEPINEEDQRAYAYTGNFFRDAIGALTAAGSSGTATAMTSFFTAVPAPGAAPAPAPAPAAGTGAAPTTPSGPAQTDAIQTLLASARQSVTASGPFDLGAAINTLGMGLANALAGSTRGQASGLVGRMGANWLIPGAAIAGNLAAGNFTVGMQSTIAGRRGTGGPVRRRGLPEEAPTIPQATGYMYLPGYRPSAQPGQQFWLPDLPGGQQFWVGANMIASGEEYRDADWLNNPQFDPNNPEKSLQRLIEVYGPLQPVPLQLLRGQGAFIGDGDRTSYMQPRTILTGARAMNANPYGLGGEAGMFQTQGAPDPRTQPELYAAWQEEVMRPRGEYGIWMESPLGKAPAFDFGQTGTGLTWKTKERTPVTATAPGMVIAVEDTPQYGKIVIVQHDFGQTTYSGLSGTGVTPGTYLATGDLVGLSGKDFSLGMQLAGQEGWVDPAPYMPSTGDRGPSGWALTDIPGVSAAEAAILVDMGFRTPEDLKERGTPAGIDQHPVFGADFNAREGWSIMSAVNALLDSGDNPNPPNASTEAWTTVGAAPGAATEVATSTTGATTGMQPVATGTATGRATGASTGGATPAAGNVTASTPAGTQEPGEFPLTAGMVAHLTEKRIANLYKNAPHLASISALAALDPNDAAQTRALAKALGTGADASDAAEIIEDIAKFKTPSANANISQHPYLFATDMRGPFTGTNITEAELKEIATKGKARTFGELAATDPAKLAADAGISLQQAKNAVAVASRYAPDAEPSSRTAPRTYTEMEAPPASGAPLTENMFPGLTQNRIDALAEANITTLGQLTMIGKPPVSLVEGGPKVNWTPDWVRANTDAEISNSDIRMLVERGEQYAANIATEGPAPGATPLTASLFDSLTANNVAELKKANITTLEQLRQIGQADAEGNVQWSSQWVSTQSGNDITPARVEVLAENANAYTPPKPIGGQTSIMSQRSELGLEFKPALAMAQNGIYNLEDLARTDTHWLRDNISGIGVKTALDAVTAARKMAGMRMATPEEEELRRTRQINIPGVIYGTDPARTETRYPFRYEQPGTGIKGISAAQEAILYGTAPTRKLAGSGNVIDTATEFADADPDWLYEASNYKWSIKDINTAQNALRERLGREQQTLSGSRYAMAAQQDLTTLGITPDQVKKLSELNIIDYGSLVAAPENLNGQIGEILKYDEGQVSGLRNRASTQMDAIRAKQEEEPEAEPAVPEPAEGVEGESSAAAPPLAESLQQPPTPESARSEYLAGAATFLGKPKEELEKLDPTAVDTMVNDRVSLYNQKQIGSGEADRRIEQFQQRYDMGASSLDAVAERTDSVTDRRQAIRIDQPLASRKSAPVAASNRTNVDMKQIASMVQQMIGDIEPRFASRIYRQLEQSLYA